MSVEMKSKVSNHPLPLLNQGGELVQEVEKLPSYSGRGLRGGNRCMSNGDDIYR
jgi:hypothetical protein